MTCGFKEAVYYICLFIGNKRLLFSFTEARRNPVSLTLAIQQGKGRLCQHSKPMEAINCIRYCAYPGIFEKKKCKNKEENAIF